MNDNGQDSLQALAAEFIAEIRDDLASLEPDLLAMEEKGSAVDDDLINHAFRSIHSIKGGAGFIDFSQLSSLSHAMENVLMHVREKKLVITSEVVDALLAGFDKMKLMADTYGTNNDTDYDCKAQETLLQKLIDTHSDGSEVLSGDTESCDIPVVPEDNTSATENQDLQTVRPFGNNPLFRDMVFCVDRHRLENAIDSQKFIYAVHIRFENDLAAKNKDPAEIIEDIKSIGEILFSGLEDSEHKDGFYCVISTILDLPLLSQVLEISRTQMVLVDRQFIDCETILKGSRPAIVPEKHRTRDLEPLAGQDEPRTDSAVQPSAESRPEPAAEQSGTPEPAMPLNPQTIRINVDLISRLMNRAGEMVVARKQLRPLIEQHVKTNSLASKMMQNLDLVTMDMQEAIMQMRMQPVVDLMGKYKRLVRDIARKMSKKVDFILEGAEVEVDRTVLEKLANPVTHLIRNCIDHGIEPPEERLRCNKPETGTIRVKAFHQGGHIHLVISDDGAGIDPQLVLSKAFEKGLVSEDQLDKLTDRQKIDLIFLPGFSTSEEITDISGRGVGMDVVKTNIERLRGHIRIESVMGKGTQIHLVIPLTLAIVPSLIVGAGDEKFAIPQINIKEIIYLEAGQIRDHVENMAGSEVLRLRGRLYSVLRLRNVLGIKTYIRNPETMEKQEEKRKLIADRRSRITENKVSEKRHRSKDRRRNEWDSTYVVIVKFGANAFGLCVDELYEMEEAVIAPLSDYIKHIKFFSGATLLGNGDVIMILDIQGIASVSRLKFDAVKEHELQWQQKKHSGRQKGEKKQLVVFTNGCREYFALELKSVARLEPFKASDIHHTASLRYMEYTGLPVVVFSMDEFISAGRDKLDKGEGFIIFPKHVSSKVGIIAADIIDTITTEKPLTKDASCSELIQGKLFIDNMMVQVLDGPELTAMIEQKIINENTDS